jgi:glycosyltransferase involved in cell wall biosynthesis
VHEYPSSWFLDRTKKMRADKERWYRGVESLTVVGVSQWSADQARSSFLSSCARSITHVYNWIDTSVFYPRTDKRAAVRRAYGIDEHAFVVLGGSASWTVGSVRYEDMCKLAERLPEGALLVLVGAAADGFPTERIRHIPYVAGKDEMARLYSAADVYVHASVEDTFGLVIAEAMACGTPAIVYDATGCPELVGEGCGCVVPVRDTDAVLCSIDAVRRAGKDAYTAACVANVRERFDYSTNAERILALYEAMI